MSFYFDVSPNVACSMLVCSNQIVDSRMCDTCVLEVTAWGGFMRQVVTGAREDGMRSEYRPIDTQ